MVNRSSKGFTIIELLIVIVVIAILAGVSLVAYGGVTQRATAAQIVSTVKSYEKVLYLYKADNGAYPSDYNWVCLGTNTDFPAGNGFAQNQCTNGQANNYWNAALHAALSNYASGIKGSHAIVNDTYGGKARGIIYDTYGTPANGASLNYFLDSNTTCPYGTKRTDFSTSTPSTMCYVRLPD